MSSLFSAQFLMDSNLHHKVTTCNSPKLAVFSQMCGFFFFFCLELTCSCKEAELLPVHPHCFFFNEQCALITLGSVTGQRIVPWLLACGFLSMNVRL